MFPKTMTQLVVAGYILTALPLAAAIALSSSALNRLAVHSERLLEEGVSAARLATRLRDELLDVERNARQFQILGEPSLYALVGQRAANAGALAANIAVLNIYDLQISLPVLQNGLTAFRAAWADVEPEGASNALLVATALMGVADLRQQVENILELSAIAMDREVLNLRQANDRAHRSIYLAVVLLGPMAVLLAFTFAAVAVRPLRRAERAIADLGHARYSRAIDIPYPREMQALGGQLDWLRRRLAQLETDKDRFLRHVTHELKTPLASLREGVSLLQDGTLGDLSPAQREVVDILDDGARELEAMVIRLLTYAEWRREREHEKAAWFSAQELMEDVGRHHRLPLTARGVQLALYSNDSEIWGQRARLHEVLDNLLSNAIKHSAEGSCIEVRADCREGQCELQVRDHGNGIPAALRATMFEPFVRGDVAEETSVRGTGIGLSIVRETIIEHGGTVEVEDEKPGLRFVLRWPCPDAAERVRDDYVDDAKPG